MAQPSNLQIPFLRVFVEGVVIVVSVLLALAADAWWDGRQAREQELAVLVGLEADLRTTLDVIAGNRRAYAIRTMGAERLIALTGDRPPDVLPITVDTLLAQALIGTRFNPVDATVSALVSSGGLAWITNPELRATLAEWTPRIAKIRRLEDQFSSQQINQFLPYLKERVPLRTLDALAVPETGLQPSGFQRDNRRLLRDIAFENGLNDILTYHRLLDNELHELRDYIDRTLVVVAAELEAR